MLSTRRGAIEWAAVYQVADRDQIAALLAELDRARASEEKFFARVNQLEGAITREVDRQAKIAAPVIVLDGRVCKWKKDGFSWQLSCGGGWFDPHGLAGPGKMHFCPKCAGKIEVSHE